MSKKKKSLRQLDFEAREEARVGANKKKFNIGDLRQVAPITRTQEDMFHAFVDRNLFLYGSAGTGKTFLSMYLGLREILDSSTDYKKMYIMRSVVPSRDIGHLPGTLEEKIEVYESPYSAICNELFPYAKSYENLKKNGYVEFMSTSYIRGITLDNCVVVVDETQNLTMHELDSIITRLGENTKIIFSGDMAQTDLTKKHDKSGLQDFLRVIERMSDHFAMINFTTRDIVRSGLVKSYLVEKEDLGL